MSNCKAVYLKHTDIYNLVVILLGLISLVSVSIPFLVLCRKTPLSLLRHTHLQRALLYRTEGLTFMIWSTLSLSPMKNFLLLVNHINLIFIHFHKS